VNLAPILTLPNEILVRVATFLDANCRAKLATACSILRFLRPCHPSRSRGSVILSTVLPVSLPEAAAVSKRAHRVFSMSSAHPPPPHTQSIVRGNLSFSTERRKQLQEVLAQVAPKSFPHAHPPPPQNGLAHLWNGDCDECVEGRTPVQKVVASLQAVAKSCITRPPPADPPRSNASFLSSLKESSQSLRRSFSCSF
jgi:hypothetical protein